MEIYDSIMTEERYQELRQKAIEKIHKDQGYNINLIEKYLKIMWDKEDNYPFFYIDFDPDGDEDDEIWVSPNP